MWKITPYKKKYSKQWEQFREQALNEGNDSLIKEKLDPENLDGILHLLWEDGELASCQAAEVDHYTDNPTAIRMCRLHTLKQFRRTHMGCLSPKFKLIGRETWDMNIFGRQSMLTVLVITRYGRTKENHQTIKIGKKILILGGKI